MNRISEKHNKNSDNDNPVAVSLGRVPARINDPKRATHYQLFKYRLLILASALLFQLTDTGKRVLLYSNQR